MPIAAPALQSSASAPSARHILLQVDEVRHINLLSGRSYHPQVDFFVR
jgi:hypothetical protein